MTRTRPLRPFTLGLVLLVVGLVVPVSPAAAADSGSPSDTGGSNVTVTVPTASPTPTTTPPPSGNPPKGGTTGAGTSGGSSSVGTSSGGGTGSAGGGAGAPAGADPGTAAPTEPTISKAPSTTADKATVDKTAYVAGDTITVTFGGFTPGEKVQVVLYSEPILIGNVDADAAGVATHTFQIPKDLPSGAHTVQMTGWASKKVAAASLVVASIAASAAPAVQGVPTWAWWSGGVLLVLLAAVGAWRLVRTMRMPREASAA